MNIGSGQIPQQLVSNTNHNMFCPGISFDGTGNLVVTGGSTSAAVSTYDPSAKSWSAAAQMNIPRGYQASSITSDGKVFTIGGSWSGGTGGKIGEIYDPSKRSWTKVSAPRLH